MSTATVDSTTFQTTSDTESTNTSSSSTGPLPDFNISPYPTPRVHYPFDGSLEDIGPTGLDALPWGALSYSSSPCGQAVNLEGSGEAVNASGAGSIVLEDLDQMSILIRLRLEQTEQPLSFIWTFAAWGEDIPTNGTALQIDQNSPATIMLDTETGEGINHTLALGLAPQVFEWIDLAFVFDGSIVRYFRDGALDFESEYTPTETTNTTLTIGGFLRPEASLIAAIDDYRWFDVALTEQQVAVLSGCPP